jgi:hypothetical protein
MIPQGKHFQSSWLRVTEHTNLGNYWYCGQNHGSTSYLHLRIQFTFDFKTNLCFSWANFFPVYCILYFDTSEYIK